MSEVTERLSALPGKWCSHIKNDHPPVCNQPLATNCRKCPEYLDGRTDIPLTEELLTKNMDMLLYLRGKRDAWYAELEPIYSKAHQYDDPIEVYEGKVREEQGR